MKRAILDADPASRRITWYAEEDGKSYIHTEQDCEGVVEAAKVMSELPHDRNMKPVCLIPQEILNQAMLEGWFHDKAKWKAWANNPDNSRFRITTGRL